MSSPKDWIPRHIRTYLYFEYVCTTPVHDTNSNAEFLFVSESY